MAALALLTPAGPRAEIAFTGLSEGYWQVWVMADDGSGRRQVTSGREDKRLPVWVDRDRLLFETNAGRLQLLDLRNGSSRAIFEGQGNFNGCDVSGGKVACARFRRDARDVSELVVGDLDAGRVRSITRRMTLFRAPRWMAGGAALVFTTRDAGKTERLARIQVETGEEQAILGEGFEAIYPDVSGDGARLAFASNETGDYEVWVLELATGARKRITSEPGLDSQPRWMAGGDIVFVSSRTGKPSLWKVSAEDGRAAALTDFPSKDPAWIAGR